MTFTFKLALNYTCPHIIFKIICISFFRLAEAIKNLKEIMIIFQSKSILFFVYNLFLWNSFKNSFTTLCNVHLFLAIKGFSTWLNFTNIFIFRFFFQLVFLNCLNLLQWSYLNFTFFANFKIFLHLQILSLLDLTIFVKKYMLD